MPERRTPAGGPAAPHAPFFRLGLLMLALSGLWWCLVLLARWQGRALPWAVSPGLAHGLLFGLGAMPQFITGFFFTAGPRWLRVPGPQTQALHLPLGLAGLGGLLILLGLHAAAPLAGLGLMLLMLAWAASWRLARRMLVASKEPDRLHLSGVHGAWLLGLCGMALTGASLMAGREDWARASLQAVLWWSLLPVFLIALHRMVPMFAEPAVWLQAAGRLPASERTLLWAGLAGCAWGGAWQVLGPSFMPPWAWALRAGLEGGVALLLLKQAWHWRHMARLPLMAMMLCGGLWLALGAGLSALSAGLLALGRPGLGLAPLHAVLAGGLASLMMAQVSRVSSAHAGRPLAVDRPLMALFLLLQLAVLLRLWAALGPSEPTGALALAALLWALCMSGWALRLRGWLRRGRAV
ncbi:NnrS family protein [Mitsuaria sp. WAJ17]|uniref:NnrS family protein n=1 Tax=Mitsuaria sp. WAJ17 TaxID=2761452 RepID=UPI0016048C34|nr:NnrS family protein [Mitsuaria sp. WAJ17]MBB2486977.1 NnrS family protein [Mitsuaria sp. WAJ17]